MSRPRRRFPKVVASMRLEHGVAFRLPGDSWVRLALMLVAFEGMIVLRLMFYGWLVSRAGQSRLGGAVRRGLERATGLILIALGPRLAVERR